MCYCQSILYVSALGSDLQLEDMSELSRQYRAHKLHNQGSSTGVPTPAFTHATALTLLKLQADADDFGIAYALDRLRVLSQVCAKRITFGDNVFFVW